MEQIVLTIGRHSSGEKYTVNLAGLPHLFISHSNERQLPAVFLSIINDIVSDNQTCQFALSMSRKMSAQFIPIIPAGGVLIKFDHTDYEEDKINSIDEFIHSLMREMKKRRKLYKKTTLPIIVFPPILVIIDNFFEVIMVPQKKTAFSFIELLMTGAAHNMFFIMGSSGIYRNLLNQLMNISPSLKQKLKKSLQVQDINQPLGAELVINPDGLLFFREKDGKVHIRIFPLTAEQ